MLSKPTKHTCATNCRICQYHKSATLRQIAPGIPQTPLSYKDIAKVFHGYSSANLESSDPDGYSAATRAAQIIRDSASNLHSMSIEEAMAQLVLMTSNSGSPFPLPTKETALQSPNSPFSIEEPKQAAASRLAGPVIPSPPTRPPPPPPTTLPTLVRGNYPLGHIFIPLDYQVYPKDPQFTITTDNAQFAYTFLGIFAIRMYEGCRAAGYDMRRYELKGPWQAVGGRRWRVDRSSPGKINKVDRLVKIEREAAADRKRRAVSEPDRLEDYVEFTRLIELEVEELREQMTEMKKSSEEEAHVHKNVQHETEMWTAGEWLRKQVNLTFRDPFFNIIWCRVRYHPTWYGAHESTMPLLPRQRPLRLGCRSDGFIWEDERDETNCTSYCHLAPAPRIIGIYELQKYDRYGDLEQVPWPTFLDGMIMDGETTREHLTGEVHSNPRKEHGSLDEDLEALDACVNGVFDSMNKWWNNMAEVMKDLPWYADHETGGSKKDYKTSEELEGDCTWILQELEQGQAQGRRKIQWLILHMQIMMKDEMDDVGDALSADNKVSGENEELRVVGETDVTVGGSGPSEAEERTLENGRRLNFGDRVSKPKKRRQFRRDLRLRSRI